MFTHITEKIPAKLCGLFKGMWVNQWFTLAQKDNAFSLLQRQLSASAPWDAWCKFLLQQIALSYEDLRTNSILIKTLILRAIAYASSNLFCSWFKTVEMLHNSLRTFCSSRFLSQCTTSLCFISLFFQRCITINTFSMASRKQGSWTSCLTASN